MAETSQQLLQALISLAGRAAFPVDDLEDIVGAGGGDKQRKAYNMCDGSRGQGEIAKVLTIDGGSFSRTVARWVDQGIMFRIGDGREAKLLHVYPLPGQSNNKRKQRS
jgi:hypothetical protein